MSNLNNTSDPIYIYIYIYIYRQTRKKMIETNEEGHILNNL